MNYAWYNGNAVGITHEVGLLKPNAWGFYDMPGNVGEYCLDWTADYGLTPESPIVENPTGPETGTYKIIRGGGYYWGSDLCKSGNRSSPGNSVTPDIDITGNSGHWGGAWVNSLGMRICATIPTAD